MLLYLSDIITRKKNMPDKQNIQSEVNKLGFSFVFIEFCVFAAQVLVFFIVSYFISDSLSSEDRLTEYIKLKMNTNTMSELGLTLFSTTFVLGLLTLIKEVSSSAFVEKISGEVLFELPRTIYLFGSSITAATIAIALFISSHPQAAPHPASGYFGLSAFFAISFFAYGCGAKAMLMSKRSKVSHERDGGD